MIRRVIGQPSIVQALSFAKRCATVSEITEALHVLGVDSKVDAKELKKKYRELVRKHHPDAGGSEQTMSKITVAYERISSLSKRDWEEYSAARNAYRGSSGFSSNSQKTYAGYQRASYGDRAENNQGHAWQQGPDFTRAYANANARATYNYNKSGEPFAESPFSRSRSPFNMRKTAQSFNRLPFTAIVARGLLVYLGVSFFFLVMYRRYGDWRHDDGWKASESLARHEQLEELHRIRQELNERISASRNRANNPSWASDLEKSRELRVAEYSKRRVLELQENEFKCWPKFDEHKGRLIKKSFDPPGITYFEPGAENEKKRQISVSFGESKAERLVREEAMAKAALRAQDISNEAANHSVADAAVKIQSILKGLPTTNATTT